MTSVPYLGLGGRLASGPSELLVRSGFSTETAYGPLLHRSLGIVDITHVLALVDAGLLDATGTATLLDALLDLYRLDPSEFPWDPTHGDPYNGREHHLAARLGSVAGRLHLGRTRREAERCAFWLATRDSLLRLHHACVGLTSVLARRSVGLAEAWWADMTYLQPAQVSTFGHYLLSSAHEAERQTDRVRRAREAATGLPVLAGGVAGTSLPLHRSSYLERLGVPVQVTTTRDAMWATDTLVEVAVSACQAVLTASRLAEDLLVFCSPAFDYIRLHDAHCRASVHLPQKRNPYALTVLRGGASFAIGRVTGVLTTVRTPTAQSDNWLHTYGEVLSMLEYVTVLVSLMAEVVDHMEVHTERLAERASAGFTDAAERAEGLAVASGIDYRTAYRRVGALATAAEQRGEDRFSEADLSELGIPHARPDDHAETVGARRVPGGADPFQVRRSARRLERRAASRRRWNEREAGHAATAVAGLLAEGAALAGGYPAATEPGEGDEVMSAASWT
ncbi:argininosuccinate lyase [Actinomycetospora sp. NBRC 106375]|uniref:lyase family protein n=1 Tax=Actinomycetospora sp. NBRC 106375 TaxID=3032207 RepID=UPI0024A1C1F5|nr:lyase family protein [Actinomycetospora sp. NBRC 106375]GLZ49332.1 argininosuccinate lyase [Actinomycetospora sp. NBRC 106375]